MRAGYDGYRSFPYRAGGSAASRAAPAALWETICGVGGEARYFAMGPLWTAREWIDSAVGGPGMARRHPTGPLKPGDFIDSWEVLVVEPERRLALIFGMKAPGRGVLEFALAPEGKMTRVTATAYWAGDGLAGLLYWRAMQPAHVVLFARMTREIARRAEMLQAAPRVQATQKSTA